MHPILNVAIRAARLAGKIIYRHLGQLETHQIIEKQANDFVTEIDRWAEKEIVATIHKFYPKHAILAEENHYPTNSTEYCWIIDPLDGTTNFIQNIPHFAVSIAVQRNTHIEHAVIYDPLREELFTASRGAGARLNDKRIRLNQSKTLKGALLGTGFPNRNKQDLPFYQAVFSELFQFAHDCRCTGSAALDLAYVAAGRLDGFWELALQPWDFAAGSLLLQEAGGKICNQFGEELGLQKDSVIAGNFKIVNNILAVLKEQRNQLNAP